MNRSEQINELATALAKAQLSFKPIVKKVENTFYTTETKKAMYADLAAVIAATQPALAANGLTVVQFPEIDREHKEAGVRSLLLHSSGQWVENIVMLPASAKVKVYGATGGSYTWGEKFDAQTCGIATTYARRYSYQGMVCVAAEEDDDGNGISAENRKEDDKEEQQLYERAVVLARVDKSKAAFKDKIENHLKELRKDPKSIAPDLQASIDATTKPPKADIPNPFHENPSPMEGIVSGTEDPFSQPLDARPLITKAEMGKGNAAECMFIEYDGEKCSVWNKSLHPFIKAGIRADLELKTTKSGQRKFINVVRAYSIGDTKFDEEHMPVIDANRDLQIPLNGPDDTSEYTL